LSFCQGDDNSITDLTVEVKVNRLDNDAVRKSPNLPAQKLRYAARKSNDEVVPQSSAYVNVDPHIDNEAVAGSLENELKHDVSSEKKTLEFLHKRLLRVGTFNKCIQCCVFP